MTHIQHSQSSYRMFRNPWFKILLWPHGRQSWPIACFPPAYLIVNKVQVLYWLGNKWSFSFAEKNLYSTLLRLQELCSSNSFYIGFNMYAYLSAMLSTNSGSFQHRHWRMQTCGSRRDSERSTVWGGDGPGGNRYDSGKELEWGRLIWGIQMQRGTKIEAEACCSGNFL